MPDGQDDAETHVENEERYNEGDKVVIQLIQVDTEELQVKHGLKQEVQFENIGVKPEGHVETH